MNGSKLATHLGTRLLLILVFLLPSTTVFAAPASAVNYSRWVPNAVYTMTNAASGNEVLALQRSNNGSVSQTAYSTGGMGSGASLGSQGSILLSEHDQLLFVVNARSNQLSVFAALPRRLVLTDVVDSGGEQPVSVTKSGSYVYVVNAGGSGNISGFTVGKHGKLTPMAGSTQPLSNGGTGASPAPAQISFSPNGHWLTVTEKTTNMIDLYEVNNGVAGPPSSFPSSGATPFGFAFDKAGHLIVTEAGPGALSSYKIGNGLEVISPSVTTTQIAACWVAVSKNGKYAYDANAASDSISSFTIGADGSLTLLNAQAGLTGSGSHPTDMDLTSDGKFLAVLGAFDASITGFEVQADGSLVQIGQVHVPAGSVGLAAR